MPAGGTEPFQYALLRVVPRADRGECFNAGVVLYCRRRGYLGIRTRLDPERLALLGPELDRAELEEQLAALTQVADGDPAGGRLAALDQSDRFGWIAGPSSTVIRPSAVHTGLCTDPEETLERLFAELVG